MADSQRARDAADSGTRARDIDRAQVSTVLDAAYAEGQLGAQEYHDRVKRAGSARTFGELRRLTADLQAPVVFGGASPQRKRFGRKETDSYPAETRARTADRVATVSVLDAARADGQLDADEHATLIELAGEARTIGDLSTLVADLQQHLDTPVKPRSRRRQLAKILTASAAVLVAVAGFLSTVRADEPDPAVAEVTVDYDAAPRLVIQTPPPAGRAGFLQFRDDLRTAFGDTLVDEAVLHETHASAVRRVPDNRDLTVGYTYRGGFERSNSPATRRDRDATDIDLDRIDADALGTALENAAVTVDIPGGSVTHLWIDGDSGEPTITIFVRNAVEQSGHVVIAPSGAVLRVHTSKE